MTDKRIEEINGSSSTGTVEHVRLEALKKRKKDLGYEAEQIKKSLIYKVFGKHDGFAFTFFCMTPTIMTSVAATAALVGGIFLSVFLSINLLMLAGFLLAAAVLTTGMIAIFYSTSLACRYSHSEVNALDNNQLVLEEKINNFSEFSNHEYKIEGEYVTYNPNYRKYVNLYADYHIDSGIEEIYSQNAKYVDLNTFKITKGIHTNPIIAGLDRVGLDLINELLKDSSFKAKYPNTNKKTMIQKILTESNTDFLSSYQRKTVEKVRAIYALKSDIQQRKQPYTADELVDLGKRITEACQQRRHQGLSEPVRKFFVWQVPGPSRSTMTESTMKFFGYLSYQFSNDHAAYPGSFNQHPEIFYQENDLEDLESVVNLVLQGAQSVPHMPDFMSYPQEKAFERSLEAI